MKAWLWMMALAACTLPLEARVQMLRDWSSLDGKGQAGVYTDDRGSQVDFELPQDDNLQRRLLKIRARVLDWAGFWSICSIDFFGDLSGKLLEEGAVTFRARSESPVMVSLGLNDEAKFQVIAEVKILGGDWQEFRLPLSMFKKNLFYQDPSVKADARMNWKKVRSINLSFEAGMDTVFYFDEIQVDDQKGRARTGFEGPENSLVVQDWDIFPPSAGGFYKDDKGSTIAMQVEKNPQSFNGYVASYDYNLKKGGWCGSWARVGDRWTRQDWSTARGLRLRVFSEEALNLVLAFNDANQNAYLAEVLHTSGKGWEVLELAFDDFVLNPHYQPEAAKPGTALDLSQVEAFNIAPTLPGRHQFKVDWLILK